MAVRGAQIGAYCRHTCRTRGACCAFILRGPELTFRLDRHSPPSGSQPTRIAQIWLHGGYMRSVKTKARRVAGAKCLINLVAGGRNPTQKRLQIR
jgi:hypothetical protein